MPKVTLTLTREFVIDLDNQDIKEMIDQTSYALEGLPSAEDIHDIIREALADDIDSVVDLDIDENDFTIKVNSVADLDPKQWEIEEEA